jgi:hypothetical protein
LEGPRRQPLAWIEAADLCAIATMWPSPGTEFGRDDLLEHHALVQALHARTGSCLPARFPTWSESEHTVREMLARRAAALGAAMEKIRGRLELAVTVLAPGEGELEDEGVGPGTRYLRQRSANQRLGASVAAHIRELLQADAVDVLTSSGSRPGIAASIAVLVPMHDADALAARLRSTLLNSRDVRILVNGPWPPYSFAVVPAREE